jgi:outer membrane protein assembly factor BamB
MRRHASEARRFELLGWTFELLWRRKLAASRRLAPRDLLNKHRHVPRSDNLFSETLAACGAEKLTRARVTVKLIAATLALGGLVSCTTVSGRVPREGNNDVLEYLGSPHRSRNPSEIADTNPTVVWRQDGGRGTLGAVAMGERLTLITSLDRFVTALNTRDGTRHWRYRGVNPYGTGPLVAEGRVFVATEGDPGVVTAINLYNGRRRWQRRVGDVAAPMAFRNGTVFVSTQTGSVAALRSDNGKVKWSRSGMPSKSGPLVVAGKVVLMSITDTLFVLDATTGVTVSKTALGLSTIAPLAAIDDSTAVMTSPAGMVVAFAIPSGQVRWRQPTQGPVVGAPVVARDSVFAVTSDGVLWIIPARNGEGARSMAMACQSVAAPAVVRDGVIVATVDGRLLYFNTASGRTVWTRNVGGEMRHPPMILNGQMIVMPVSGKVVSYR